MWPRAPRGPRAVRGDAPGGGELRPGRHRRAAAGLGARACGALAIAPPFNLITFGEHHVPSGLTAVLSRRRRCSWRCSRPSSTSPSRSTGARARPAVGIVGVGLLVGVESVSTLGEFLGALAMIGAAACYALATFVVKGYGGIPAVVTSCLSVAAGFPHAPPRSPTSPTKAPGLRAVLALIGLGALGTAFAFVIYYRLIGEFGASRASLVAYLAPPSRSSTAPRCSTSRSLTASSRSCSSSPAWRWRAGAQARAGPSGAASLQEALDLGRLRRRRPPGRSTDRSPLRMRVGGAPPAAIAPKRPSRSGPAMSERTAFGACQETNGSRTNVAGLSSRDLMAARIFCWRRARERSSSPGLQSFLRVRAMRAPACRRGGSCPA